MKQLKLEDFPELRPTVEYLETVQQMLRCTCACHGWPRDEWPYPDCPVCECATLPSEMRKSKYGGILGDVE